jgi:hypothetical protein
MTQTIVALFDEREQAYDASLALMDAGFTRGDIDAVTEVGPGVTGHYAEAVRAGDVLLAVRALGDSAERAVALLQQYEPLALTQHAFDWSQEGWEGFEVAASEIETDSIAETRAFYEEKGEEGHV